MLQPELEQLLELAQDRHHAGRLVEAESLYRQVLADHPKHADSIYFLGLIAAQSERTDEAVDLIQRAILLDPGVGEYHCDLGLLLARRGGIDQAILAYRQALALDPGLAEAHFNLANALREKGDLDGAIESFGRASALRPSDAGIHNNFGSALAQAGRLQEAIAALRQALVFQPEFPQALSNLGVALCRNDQLDEGISCLERALHLKPHYPQCLNNLANALKDQGRLEEAIAIYDRALGLDPDDAQIHSNRIYAMHFLPQYDAAAVAKELRSWNQRHAKPLAAVIGPHANDRAPNRRLRIGYVSPDFRRHVVGSNMLSLLSRHNHQDFEVYCYAKVSRPDSVTEQIRGCSDVWRDIAGCSDERAAQIVREDRIDILVDLTLHLENNALLLFARKPAPIQVSYLGYPGSTGLEAMDYRISDPYLDPPLADLTCYSEQTVRLPMTYWCYQPNGPAPDVAASPVLTFGHITFGCLNNFAKVSGDALQTWAQILARVPRSRLLLHSRPGKHLEAVRHQFGRAGISPDRIQFVGTQAWPDYIRTYQQIDIALDPFPHGGGITSCDALWMGVAVITLEGATAVGRGSASVLRVLDLNGLIARTSASYIDLAKNLAQNVPRLKQLRSSLRDRMLGSPLMDAWQFARDMESCFRQLWISWCSRSSA